MADDTALKVMTIFEAGTKLRCNSETICLAAHVYHRFFRIQPQLSHYDLYTFAAACLKLAYTFYELDLSMNDLILSIMGIVHGPQQTIDRKAMNHLEHSINVARRIISINLNFHIDYKDTLRMTPGALLRANRSNLDTDNLIPFQDPDLMDVEEEEEEEEIEDAEALLANNSRYTVSAHRYLAHYLKSIQLLVDTEHENEFRKVTNIAWTFLNDFFWTPCVTQHFANHLACACLMMAIEVVRPQLNRPARNTFKLWKLLDRRWNLILCDDLSNVKVDIIIGVIIKQYAEYERVFEHEFSVHVIDPCEKV